MFINKRRAPIAAAVLFSAAVAGGPAIAQGTSAPAARDPATVAVPAAELPYTTFASPQARAAFTGMIHRRPGDGPGPEIADQRRFYQKFNDDLLAEMNRAYRSNVTHGQIGGVTVDTVTPAAGIAPGNAARVLINLHGGAFMWGSGSGALVEAIPIAAVARIKVVTVDYRLAPEHRYPAGSEDVAAVYKELLKQYRPENIGIYGCSAGGALTAQATAWIIAHGMPRPGAIGTFCGTGLPFGGDSGTLGNLATGAAPMPPPPPAARASGDAMPYLRAVDPADPLAYPGNSPEMLAKFPPTLLLAGGRDFAVSSLTTMQRRLAAAGVDARLVLFDGLWHAFFVSPDLPESKEAYAVIAGFFDRNLGHATGAAR